MSSSNLYNSGNKQNPYSNIYSNSLDTKVSNVDEQFTPPNYPLIPLVAPAGAIHTNGNDSMYLSDGAQWNLIGSSSPLTPTYMIATKPNVQTIPYAAFRTITNWDTLTGSGNLSTSFNTTTGILTIPTDGVYMVSTGLVFQSNPTGYRYVILEGATNLQSTKNAVNGFDTQFTMSSTIILTTGTELQLRCFQTSGGDVDGKTSYLSVVFLGPI